MPAIVLSAVCRLSAGADLVEVLPLTDRIIMLVFDEGYIEHYGYHESGDDEVTHRYPLNLSKAQDLTSYRIWSPDDPAYQTPEHPSGMGRKSGGSDFSWKCKWNTATEVCENDYISRHYIYLRLPAALEPGCTYRVSAEGQDSFLKAFSFAWHADNIRSEAVHVNQLGYAPEAGLKYAYIYHWMGSLGPLNLDTYAGSRFHLVDLSTGQRVYSGDIALRKDLETGGPDTGQESECPFGNFSGADVWECDFSDFSDTGEYVVSVEGIGCSYPFEIHKNAYREAYYLTARALYHQRSGLEIEPRYTRWARPRDHHYGDGLEIYRTDVRTMDLTSENGDREVVENAVAAPAETYGWYHDAGDWDGYLSHLAVPAYLMTAWEFAPSNFRDGGLDIPESGNGIPDILDEASWLLKYLRRSKDASGGIGGARVHGNFGSTGDGIPSWEDERTWYVFAADPVTSYKYAALSAHLSYCLEACGHPDSAAAWLAEAENAWEWAGEHTLAGDDVQDDRMYAAAWMFKKTGQPTYETSFKSDNRITQPGVPPAGTGYDQQWGAWCYATTENPDMDTVLRNTVRQAVLNRAREINTGPAKKRSCRMGFHWYFPTLVGQATTPWVIESLIAYEISGESEYLDYMYTTCDYMLGGNPLNMTWVTGTGDRSPSGIMHLDSWFDTVPEVLPGIVPYGPHRGQQNGYNGPWDPDFARDRVFPPIDQWPVHEAWFENRCCPATNEFTIHQNIAPAAAIYGYLGGPAGSFTPNTAPSIRLKTDYSDSSFTRGDTILFVHDAADPDGRIMKVEYFAGPHKIGIISQPADSFLWKHVPKGNYTVYALATDNKGKTSRPGGTEVRVADWPAGLPGPAGDKCLIRAFPVPCRDHVRFSCHCNRPGRIRIRLFDMAGREIFSREQSRSTGGHYETTIVFSRQLPGLPPGVYMFRFDYTGKGKGFSERGKIIVQ